MNEQSSPTGEGILLLQNKEVAGMSSQEVSRVDGFDRKDHGVDKMPSTSDPVG